MSNIDYFRQNPAWATAQWQPPRPPAPSFQPEPSWSGYDFFKAAVGDLPVDSELYGYGKRHVSSQSHDSNGSSYNHDMRSSRSSPHSTNAKSRQFKPIATKTNVKILPKGIQERKGSDKAVLEVVAKLRHDMILQQETRQTAELLQATRLQHRRVYGGRVR